LLLCHVCRFGTISLLFLPALGWVAFNMAQPAFNQLNRMNDIKEEAVGAGGKKKRGLAGAVGLGAALSMMAAQQADAATELSQLAASDNRCVLQAGSASQRCPCS
jgi:photosystem II PsbY protein